VNGIEADVQRAAYRERLDTFLASRDAGRTLTYDALRSGITLEAVTDAARRVAEYTDEALVIVADEYRPALDCKAGCSYCCRKPNVLASVPEIANIARFVKENFSADGRRDLEERARRYRKQTEGRRVEDPTNESVPCPLLIDDRCSVYEVRPLICRGYNSTNVDVCRRAHSDATVLVPTFALLKDVTSGATVGAAQQLHAAGVNDAMVDLGTALGLILEADDQFVERVVESRADLAPAENATWTLELWSDVCQIADRLGVHIEPATAQSSDPPS
jgi:Fe-S-cluster containining protein